MTDQHAFSVIDHAMVAVIVETGLLNLDREILVQHPDGLDDGVASEFFFFVNTENVKPISVLDP